MAEGVELRHWQEPLPVLPVGEVVIEAFACELPESFQQRMAAEEVTPVWINLEYLSAEPWVADCHGLASPHPRLPLAKHFFFPGFDARSGGLLREAGLIGRVEAFRSEGGACGQWRAAQHLAAEAGDVLRISLFAYRQPGLAGLLRCWAEGERAVQLLVPEGKVLVDLAPVFGGQAVRAGDRLRQGALEVRVLPFRSQDDYDRLLWCSDLNFVRGEDSFVRAQWAGRALVWQIYPQANDVHLDKLDAFMAQHFAGLDADAALAARRFWRAWNGDGEIASAWPDFLAAMPRLDAHAREWRAFLAAQDDLGSRLIEFCSHRGGRPV